MLNWRQFRCGNQGGLRDADLTILFWSPEAARSDWTRLEYSHR
jgi:hypothetical protein